MRLFYLVLCTSALLQALSAKQSSCVFKNLQHDNLTTCELKNVNYNGREYFEVKYNKTLLFKSADVQKEEQYDDEDESASDYVDQIKFESSKLTTIPNTVFSIFQQLKIFDGSGIDLHYITSLSFNGATNLIKIFLHDNRLTIINNYCFVHTKNLKTLDLSNNKISTVQPFAFNSLVNLEELSLSSNNIAEIVDSTCLPLVNLKWILLDQNQLSIISSGMFSKVNEVLEGISVKTNKIDLISPNAFDELPKLRFLLVDGNNCINRNFINHVIQGNTAIKKELHECHKAFRKNIGEEEKYNVSLFAKREFEILVQCNVEMERINEIMKTVQSKIDKISRAKGN